MQTLGFIDHHVHLGLIDTSELAGSEITGVVDLGWDTSVVGLAEGARASGLRVDLAGRFLTAPGGYPSDRAWAPDDSVGFVAGPAEAAHAVEAQRALGATVVKLVLNSDDGPVPSVPTIAAVVAAAEGMPVVAHCQGSGMVELALAGGVGVLAHTPWTHRLDDAVVEECAAGGQRWISTLDIHGYGERTPDQARALDNVGRFHRAGGTVLYGTDLGNGPLPVGLNQRELELLGEAGLSDDAVTASLVDPWPLEAT
jgi:imidazolonepropionase-like amidohydrolase